jgi:hypothetical protein
MNGLSSYTVLRHFEPVLVLLKQGFFHTRMTWDKSGASVNVCLFSKPATVHLLNTIIVIIIVY